MTSPRSSFAAQSRTSIIVIKIIVAFAVAIIINNLISMVIMSTMLVLDIVVARIDDVISFPYRADAKPATNSDPSSSDDQAVKRWEVDKGGMGHHELSDYVRCLNEIG